MAGTVPNLQSSCLQTTQTQAESLDAISLLSSIRLFAQSLCPMLSLQFFPRCIDLTEGPVSTTALMAPGDAQQENWRSVQRGLRREQRKMLSGSSCPGSSANLGRSRARHQSASSSSSSSNAQASTLTAAISGVPPSAAASSVPSQATPVSPMAPSLAAGAGWLYSAGGGPGRTW